MYKVSHDGDDFDDDDDDCNDDESDEETMYSAVTRKQITSKSICAVCGGRGHYSRVEGMDCLTKQLGISIPRSELAQTKYPSGITFPFSDTQGSSSGFRRRAMHGANIASSTRKTGKSKQITHKPNPKSIPRRKPKRVNQVDEHDSERVEHEHEEQDEDHSSDGDVRADFATLAVTYNTIDIRHDTYNSDESSDDSSKYRRLRRPH